MVSGPTWAAEERRKSYSALHLLAQLAGGTRLMTRVEGRPERRGGRVSSSVADDETQVPAGLHCRLYLAGLDWLAGDPLQMDCDNIHCPLMLLQRGIRREDGISINKPVLVGDEAGEEEQGTPGSTLPYLLGTLLR